MKKFYIHIFKSLLLVLITNSFSSKAYSQEIEDQIFKLTRAFRVIHAYYVDSVNESKLIDKAIIEMLKNLDPHSTYLTPDEVQETNENLEGFFPGIGIQYFVIKDTIVIVSTIENSPAQKANLINGDRLIKIDSIPIIERKLKDKQIQKLIRGALGSTIKLTIKRPGQNNLVELNLMREKIPIYSIESAYMVDKNIGYIRLNRFAATSVKEFNDALTKLKSKGLENLILDLRDNGGGYLQTAIDLTDEFLSDNKLIVYTQGANSPRSEYFSTNMGSFEDGNLVILIDEGTASASEILTGAIQDWDRGVVVGRRSFGKGLVQRPFSLQDGSLIRLTTARYYTPSGRLIQKSYNMENKDYKKEIENRYRTGQMTSLDSIHFADTTRYITKVKKRVVYGGGGIMPDYFVPMDTTGFTGYYKDIVRKGILNAFVIDYIESNRKNLQTNYPHFNQFKRYFTVTDNVLTDLKKFANRPEFSITKAKNYSGYRSNQEIILDNDNRLALNKPNNFDDDFTLSKDEIRKQIKALIAKDLWKTNEYFEILNENDATMNKAIEILKNKFLYEAKLK